MTDTQPIHKSPRSRLLRFLIPVLLVHGLLLAVLPYWIGVNPSEQRGVNVELSPVTADSRDVSPPPPVPVNAEPPEPSVAVAPPVAVPAPAAPIASTPVPKTVPPASPAKPRLELPNATRIQAEPSTQAAPGGADSPSAAPRTGTADSRWRDNYLTALHTALAQLHRYPPRARRFGLSGEVRVAITIQRDGRFSDVRLESSSQAELLDQAALETVRRLDHFRPLPADYSEDSWVVSVPLVYRLN